MNILKRETKKHLNRRQFFRSAIGGSCAACALAGGGQLLLPSKALAQDVMPAEAQGIAAASDKFLAPARHWEKRENKRILCTLCPRQCEVADLERGGCGVRENRGGEYFTLVYNRPCSFAVDPIEKKPLFHFLPGTTAYSTATAGCNIWCRFCQNWTISQKRPEQVRAQYTTPEQMVSYCKGENSPTIAFTYNEPVVFYEWACDVAKAAKERGVRSVIISNGYIEKKPLRELCQVLSAVKIDLKAFTEKFYAEICDGKLKPVLDTLVELKSIGIWFEIVVLIIPTLNDSEKECREMCKWIVANLGPDVPVHFSCFHPMYMLNNLPSTSPRVVERNRKTAMEAGIRYSYVGNAPGLTGENTFCHNCHKQIIDRYGYSVRSRVGADGKCPNCATKIPGVWA
ncbi:AmmeMemoRadiSam system radical SAM enzyme [Candidatus Sumerlaeota bacterium]|nr:AmmeMemoRadiSam system radical SAM enzyme [Candidatus Sumerlaeota bacterium]